jgi:nucleoside phosphorylase/CheY-like chemotaxis protein
MRILIVEDTPEKAASIRRVIDTAIDDEAVDVVDVTDGVAARQALASDLFDLLILDIALPRRAHESAATDEGLLLLEEVISHPQRFRTPAHIVGITAYPEIFERGTDTFSSRLFTLVLYDPASSEWQNRLGARLRHIRDALRASVGTPPNYDTDLAILCALDSPELTQVLALPWSWRQDHVAHDHTIYRRGSFLAKGLPHSVVAAATARMGMPAATALASKLIAVYRPRYLAMVGIAAGIRGRVEIGDIVVADPSWDWGSGKWTLRGSTPKFLAAPHQLRLSAAVREKVRLLARDSAALSRIRDEWPGNKPSTVLSLRIGPMASGACVLADGQTADAIVAQHRELLAIEMETYGMFAAAEECSDPRPLTFSLKTVVDFADGEKNDRLQEYGAYVSARIVQYFAENYLWG